MASTTNTPAPKQQTQALLNGPAGAPPHGVTPNLNDPSTMNRYTILVLVLGLTCSTLAIFLRTYTRLYLMRSRAYEDYIVIMAWLDEIVQVFPYVKTAQYGSGTHVWNISLDSLSHLVYWSSVAGAIYVPVIFLIKLSILLQFLGIFASNREGNMFIFVGVHLCILVNLIVYSILEFSAIFACKPREKSWMPWLDGRCLDVDAIWKATGLFNCLSDFAILALPLLSVWRLQIPLRRKILVSTVFATGLCACIAAIIRTYYTWSVTQSPDFSYNIVLFGVWTYTELAIGIIISCLPVIPRFFQHFGPKVRATFSFSTASKTNSGFGKPFAPGPGPSSDTTVAAIKRKIPFTRKTDRLTGSNEDDERIELKRQYVTLSEVDERADDGMTGEMHGSYGAGLGDLKDGRAGEGGDLEEGKGDTGRED